MQSGARDPKFRASLRPKLIAATAIICAICGRGQQFAIHFPPPSVSQSNRYPCLKERYRVASFPKEVRVRC